MSMRVYASTVAASVLALGFAASAQAAPAASMAAPVKSLAVDTTPEASVQQVHYRRHHWRWHRHQHRHHRHHWRWRW